MKKLTLALTLFSLVTQGFAVKPVLEGFKYADMKTPVGNEWESPEQLALNKEQPRAWFFPFADVESARKVGQLIAERAKGSNVSAVVFDRGGHLYHGKIKALADAAREGGLQF